MQGSFVVAIGHITKDPVLKKGNRTDYIRLNLAANSGFGENEKTVFYQATFFGRDAERIVKAKVKKGSFITLTGGIEDVLVFQAEGSDELLSMIKVKPYEWDFVPVAKKGESPATTQEPAAPTDSTHVDPADFPEVECGVEDELPV